MSVNESRTEEENVSDMFRQLNYTTTIEFEKMKLESKLGGNHGYRTNNS